MPGGLTELANRLVLVRLPYVLLSQWFGKDRWQREDTTLRRARFLNGLRLFADRAAADGASFGLVLFGDPLAVSERAAARAAMKELGIPLLDLSALLADEENRIPRDTHLSPRGHRVVAQAVNNWLNALPREWRRPAADVRRGTHGAGKSTD